MIESRVMNSAVVAVGNELLIGKTVDTNGSWLSEKLTDLGVPVAGRWVTGDDPGSIQDCIKDALEKADIVIVTGGLGPTSDDLTRPAVADLFRHKLIEDPVLVQRLHDRFSAMGYDSLPQRNLVQAKVPEGAIVIDNKEGTAPGLIIEDAGRVVILLPGVPREMKMIFDLKVKEYINSQFRSHLIPTLERTFNTSGIPESLLAEEMAGHTDKFPPDVSLAFLPGLQGGSLRITTPDTDGKGLARLGLCEEVLMPVIAPHFYSMGATDIVDTLASLLLSAKKNLAVGESCTGGLISKRITDRPGSSRYFRGGIIAYDVETKSSVLGIEKQIIATKGVVSQEVASLLAERSARLMNADFGIGITGVAGPGVGSSDVPVGTVCYAVFGDGRVHTFQKVFGGNRQAVRTRAAQVALFSFFQMLTNKLD